VIVKAEPRNRKERKGAKRKYRTVDKALVSRHAASPLDFAPRTLVLQREPARWLNNTPSEHKKVSVKI